MSMTVNVPDELARRLTAEAHRRCQDVDQVAAEVLAAGLPAPALPAEAPERPARRRLSFIGIGASAGRGENVAERHREIIREHFADKTASDV